MKTMRVLFVLVGSQTNFPWVSPPLGILSLAAYLRHRFNLDIRVLDQRAEDCPNDTVVSRAAEFGADVVGLSCTTPGMYLLPGLTADLRRALPNALLLLGGPHASASGTLLLATTACDCVVRGEGEVVCEQILRIWQEGSKDFSPVPGLIWRDSSGQAVTNPGAAPTIQDLDTLPFPAYDLLDIRTYWSLRSMSLLPEPRRYISMFTSRGCPYRCIYCHNIFGKRFRSQGAERMVDEIEHYTRAYGIKEVEFFDDIFNFDANRVIQFSETLRRRGLRIKISFPNAIRADILTQDVADALAYAGTNITALALESGSPRIQELIQKRLNIPKYLEGVEMLVNRRIFTYAFIMFGFPSETESDMEMTVEVLRRSKLHAVFPFVATPYPNTELFDIAVRLCPEKMGNLNYGSSTYTDFPCVNLSEVSDKTLAAYMRKACSALYLNPIRALRIIRDYPRRWSMWRYWHAVFVVVARLSPKYGQGGKL